jgi:hypothetical protein
VTLLSTTPAVHLLVDPAAPLIEVDELLDCWAEVILSAAEREAEREDQEGQP